MLPSSQFGVDIDSVLCSESETRYLHPIPVVLTELLTYLRNENALRLEGIFRLSANDEQCLALKLQLNRHIQFHAEIVEILRNVDDVHCVSTLIKRWYRELPTPILQPILPNIRTNMDEKEVVELIKELDGQSLALLLWFLDLCCEISSFVEDNKMTIQNTSLMMSPNLIPLSLTANDALTNLALSSKVHSFIHQALQWRIRYPNFNRS